MHYCRHFCLPFLFPHWKGRKGEPDGCAKKAQRVYQENSGWLSVGWCWISQCWLMFCHGWWLESRLMPYDWCSNLSVSTLGLDVISMVFTTQKWFPLWLDSCLPMFSDTFESRLGEFVRCWNRRNVGDDKLFGKQVGRTSPWYSTEDVAWLGEESWF